MTPDLSVLLKSIDSIVAAPLQAHSQISFRMSLLRYNLQVDLRPTNIGVDSMFKGLLTEFEQIAYLKEGLAEDVMSPKAGPKARGLEVPPPPPPKTAPLTPAPLGSTGCKFFGGIKAARRKTSASTHMSERISHGSRDGQSAWCVVLLLIGPRTVGVVGLRLQHQPRQRRQPAPRRR